MKKFIVFLLTCFIIVSCKKKEISVYQPDKEPTPYQLNIPSHFPDMQIPADNEMTVEGVELGRKLFYETQLSLDNSISCASCHNQVNAFSDTKQYSLGVNDSIGTRNSMALVNLGWQQNFFWDGRAKSLEELILEPVENPIEMHLSWVEAEKRINAIQEYKDAFKLVFKTNSITKVHISKAIAQFLRTLISGNSKFDVIYKYENKLSLSSKEQEIYKQITPEEWYGYDLFKSLNGADCFHCHNGTLMQVNKFSNNGLDFVFKDLGRGKITGNSNDNGKFKVPTLRNIALTAPYMHDGRFKTLDELIEHYSTGIHQSPTIDPLIEYAFQGGVQLDDSQKQALKAFLNTLTDYEFISNPEFKKP